MCLGIPMQVIEPGDGTAICEGLDGRRQIAMQLIGDQPAGTWVLTYLDAAREVITEAAARQITDAVTAVNLVMRGETDINHLFADLIDREIEPPPSMPRPKTG
ncbi:MAG: HypC/HybG/HupF family hydrogenase formation chaperone [Pseudomonadota bacterium]